MNIANVGTPEMYGAKADGVTDDFLAIKKAFISHSVIQFDAKTYAVRGMLGVPSYRVIKGAGKDRTIIKLMDNSPFSYEFQCYVFNNTFLQNDVFWMNASSKPGGPAGTLTGAGTAMSLFSESTDRKIVDQASGSVLYRKSQSTAWGGLGYWNYDGINGLRRDVMIKDMTIDCNFNKQARHKSYNWTGNPRFSVSSYIPELSQSVRTTIQGIALAGENITLENIKVINYGYGVSGLNSVGKIDWTVKTPNYIEEFCLSINGSINSETLSGSYVDKTNYSYEFPNSRLYKNRIINCEVGKPGNVDLMNYISNATAFVCSNATLAGNYSTYPSDGEMVGCVIDPGYNPNEVTASFWIDKYLDEYLEPTLKGPYTNLFDYFRDLGSYFGNDGQIAITKGPYPLQVLKKISGSWFPNGSYTPSPFKYAIHGYTGGGKVSNCVAKNIKFGFYHDTFVNDVTIENNKFENVGNGIFINSYYGPTNPTFKNMIIKDNYVKLIEHLRPYFYGGSNCLSLGNYSVYDNTSYVDWVQNKRGKTTNHDNVIIENNVFELPISSSKSIYTGTANQYGPSPYYNYPYFGGIYFTCDVSGSKFNFFKNFVIKNNKFINFNPSRYSGYSPYGEANTSVISTNTFILTPNDTPPYTNTRDFYVNNFLRTYTIEGNTHNSPVYPSTASMSPISFNISAGGLYTYAVDQMNKIGNGFVYGDINVTGQLTAAGTKYFLIDHPTKSGKKLQHGSLESPYHGIRHTGKSKTNKNGVKVELPNYIHSLVQKENVNIQLTPINSGKLFYVSKIDIDNNCFYVICDQSDEEYEFFWDFTAIRKDVDNLVTEF